MFRTGDCHDSLAVFVLGLLNRPFGTDRDGAPYPGLTPFPVRSSGHVAHAAIFTESRTRLSASTSFTGNPGPSWAILSRPFGTDRDKPGELICFNYCYPNSADQKELIWTRLSCFRQRRLIRKGLTKTGSPHARRTFVKDGKAGFRALVPGACKTKRAHLVDRLLHHPGSCYFLGGAMVSLAALATRNLTTVLALILMVSPV